MKRPTAYTLICLLTVLPYNNSSDHSAELKTLVMGATDWCPYTCPSLPGGGLVTKYLREVFELIGIQLKVHFYPWVRAINYAKIGEIDGLLTAVRSEVPDLLLTSTPTMNYQTCFYTRRNYKWKYSGKKSLSEVKDLIIAEGYGYGEPLDSYIAGKPKNLVVISGTKIVDRMASMLLANRISAFAQDPLIIQEYKELNHEIFNKGCQSSSPFFIAFRKTKYFKNELIPKLNEVLKVTSKELLPAIIQDFKDH